MSITKLPHKIALGKDWGFRDPLYFFSLQYFIFHNAMGGHANCPPELFCFVEFNDNTSVNDFVEDLKCLLETYGDTTIAISRNHGNVLKIEVLEWTLLDYDFELALEIEKVIQKHQGKNVDETVKSEYHLLYKNVNSAFKDDYHSVETITKFGFTSDSVYFDCHLRYEIEEQFVSQIKELLDDFEFDSAKLHKKVVNERVSFQVSLIKYKTTLSKQGKYLFNLQELDKRITLIVESLGIVLGRIDNDNPEDMETLLLTKRRD